MPLPAIAVGLVTLLLTGLRTWAASIIGSALATMGLYFFVAEPAADLLTDQLHSRYNLVSGTVKEVLNYCNVDDFMAMIAAAIAVRAVYAANAQLKINKAKAKPGRPVGAGP